MDKKHKVQNVSELFIVYIAGGIFKLAWCRFKEIKLQNFAPIKILSIELSCS